MMNPKFRLGDNAPTVSWAEPKNAESSAASQVLTEFYVWIIFIMIRHAKIN